MTAALLAHNSEILTACVSLCVFGFLLFFGVCIVILLYFGLSGAFFLTLVCWATLGLNPLPPLADTPADSWARRRTDNTLYVLHQSCLFWAFFHFSVFTCLCGSLCFLIPLLKLARACVCVQICRAACAFVRSHSTLSMPWVSRVIERRNARKWVSHALSRLERVRRVDEWWDG